MQHEKSKLPLVWLSGKIIYYESLDFCTVHSLMNDIILIDSCQAHLPVPYASNIEFICQKVHWCCH